MTLLGLAISAGTARAQTTEAIQRYDVQIRIQPDDALRIVERIRYDFGPIPHHGIYRDVPTRLHFDDTYDRIYPLHVESVRASAGTPADYDVGSTSGGKTRIKIGDPDRTITGVHTYTVEYTVEQAMNAFVDHDELYWNAIGDEWAVPIERAGVSVTAPGRITQVACFAGDPGSALPCGSAAARGDRAAFGQRNLFPTQGLTVVVALPKGIVATPRPVLDERWTLAGAFRLTPASGGVAGGLLAVIVGGMGFLWWRRGRDRRYEGSPIDQVMGNPSGGDRAVPLGEGHASAPVEFAPPDGLRPGQVGTLLDERANTLDVTATIIDLAVRGFLLIQEIPKSGWFDKPDWTLIRLDKATDDLRPYERKLLEGLFRDGTEVGLSALKATFHERLEGVESALYTDAVDQGWFSTRPDKVRSTWSARGVMLLILGAVLTFLLARSTHWGLVGVAVLLAGFVLLASGGRMASRTAKGTAALRRIRGFRTVIETADTNMARWAEQENVFTTFLPYAVVFGCTDKWAKAFEGLAAQPADASWYVTNRAFVYTDFAQAIDGFSVTTSGIIASTPAGSGSSGFGGGGFSGGGGGGGGGGSW